MTATEPPIDVKAAPDGAVQPDPSPVQPLLSAEERTAAAERLVKRYTAVGTGVGLIPVPVFDLVALVSVQLKMLHGLSRLYGVEFRKDRGRAAVSSLIGGILPVGTALPVASSLVKVVPFAGSALGYLTLPVFGGASTFAVGRVFVQHFESNGTLLTFDPAKVRDYFAEQFEAGKRVVARRRAEQDGGAADDGKPTGKP